MPCIKKKFRTSFKKDCALTLLIPENDFKWPKKNIRAVGVLALNRPQYNNIP